KKNKEANKVPQKNRHYHHHHPKEFRHQDQNQHHRHSLLLNVVSTSTVSPPARTATNDGAVGHNNEHRSCGGMWVTRGCILQSYGGM
ncbi:hypothetical protein PIB30_087592, partial [Stylosanthes scabra]|nr:hypothetical protein [Stylosanthes scabra]